MSLYRLVEGDVHIELAGEPGVITAKDGYAVYLPHSCDEWVIAASADPREVEAKVLGLIDQLYAAVDALKWGIRDAG
jgi:hypothetical protein